MKTTPLLRALAPVALLVPGLAACSVQGAGADEVETITIGYQSKTINTVTAGTLLRERGFFEEQLKEVDSDLRVEWQDYDTGAPITAQMLAGKIDIGSMGDYPLLINGSRAGEGDSSTSMVSVTGYNARGGLNGVVVAADSPVQRLTDLEGKKISASVGSAGHGTLVQALDRAGIDPTKDVTVENQDPPVGASSLSGGSVDAVSQFVAWPALLAFRDDARLVYDGAQLDLPTMHGVVVRDEFASENEKVVQAFLRAQLEATEFIHENPLEAAEIVAEETGLPAEVVYLYNGRNGVSTFDPTIKQEQVDALQQDVPFLKSIGVMEDPLDVDRFVDDTFVKEVYEGDYDADATSLVNPAAISGRDEVCGRAVKDVATAGELWVEGEDDTRPAADPTCLLRALAEAEAAGDTVRAAYVPDALTGTRWFADRMVWLREGARLVPFATAESAEDYRSDNPSARPTTYDQALELAGRSTGDAS